MVCYHMKPKDAVALYTRYVGDWGTTSTVYKFEAVRDGKSGKDRDQGADAAGTSGGEGK